MIAVLDINEKLGFFAYPHEKVYFKNYIIMAYNIAK